MCIFLKCVFSTIYPVLTQPEKLFLANRERDKGNDAFRANDYEEAVAYYSRSAYLLSKAFYFFKLYSIVSVFIYI